MFADIGIPSMRDHFAAAMAVNPDDLTPEHLFDVLDAVAVRRTRSFVKRYYSNDTVPIRGVEQAVTFPTPRVRKVSYDLDAVLPGFFDRIARALDPDSAADDPDALDRSSDAPDTLARASDVPDRVPDDPDILKLARYSPSRYRIGKKPERYEMQLAGCCCRGC